MKSPLLKALLRPLFFALYFAGGLIPRNRRLWVFGSWHGKRMADNSKWLFLHVAHKESSAVRAVWISKDRRLVSELSSLGYEAYFWLSLRGLWTCLRAGVYLFDVNVIDINFWTSCRARKVNLWHGIPLKKIERDIDNPNSGSYRAFHGSRLQRALFAFRAPWNWMRSDLVISTSSYVAGLFQSAFDLPRERVPVTGYPRNDVLLDPSPVLLPRDEQALQSVLSLKSAGQKVLFYMPTWRDTGGGIPIDWSAMEAFLRSEGATLLLKLHPADRGSLPSFAPDSPIRVLPTEWDPYPILREVDVLVTDYSSVYFDFLLTGRPIVFYAYDLEKYRTADRSLYVPYEEATPGHRAFDFESLLRALKASLQGELGQGASREEVFGRCFHSLDANSASRVFREVFQRYAQ